MSENYEQGVAYKAPPKLWMELCTKKEPYLLRARECSALTIPNLFPPEGHSYTQSLATPWQGLGARGVNNLASKLLLALFPPNSPFFRLRLDEGILAELEAGGDPKIKSEIEASLSRIERKVNESIESGGMRVVFFEALKHLLVAGNVLIHIPEEGIRLFRLDQYCITRDGLGNVCDIVTKECISYDALEPDLQKMVNQAPSSTPEKDIEIWTHIERLDDGRFESHQTLGDIEVVGSRGIYKEEELPWIPLRLSAIAGESYGRGFVEEYKGDLRSLEGLTKAIVEGSAAAARLVLMVRPNGTTRIGDITKAENGGAIKGHKDDVSFLQVEKFNDFRTAAETINTISTRLASAFLLNSAVARNAERVTAEEVRYMAQELEEALGGVYTVLAQEWQLPLLHRILARLKENGDVANLPNKGVKPVVITGVEALGRGHDLNRLQVFFAAMQQAFGPQEFARRVNMGEAISRMLSALGIDEKNLIRTDEELAQEAQASMMNQAILKGAGPVAGKVAGPIMESMMGGSAPQPQ